MSRCFAYTPVVVRNGAALIDSIKLQKEADKAKAKRKDEKRAKKEQKQKEKEKRKEEEKRKTPMNPFIASKEVPTNRTEPTTEPRERSDLTEEHGQPISSQPSHSSDSTQNSNKRKREDAVIPDGSSGHGKPIKIRLLKKPKLPDPCHVDVPLPSTSNSLNEPRRVDKTLVTSIGKTRVPVSSGRENSASQGVSFSQTKSFNEPCPVDRTLVTSIGKARVPVTSGRENNSPQGIPFRQTKSLIRPKIPKTKNNDLQAQLDLARKPSAASSPRPAVSASQLKHEIPSSHSNKTEVLPVPSRSRNSDVDVRQSSRPQQPIPVYGRPVVPHSHVEHEMPSLSFSVPTGPSVSKRIDVQGARSGGQQSGQNSGTPVLPQSHLQNGNRTFTPVLGKRSLDEMRVPGPNGPTRLEQGKEVLLSDVPQKVGRSRSEKGKQVLVGEVPQKVVPTRFEKKIMKKHSYEKLIGSFVPPPLLAPCGGGEDEDWLSKRVKTVKSSSRNDAETCESAALSLWQPCARFLVDADIYALPYTVPF